MAKQVPVPARLTTLKSLDRVDYEDAFAVQVSAQRTAEQWARLAMERAMADAPPALRGFLIGLFKTFRFRLAPPDSPDHVLGWEILHNGPQQIVLGTESALGVTARIIFLTPPGHAVFATLIRLNNPIARAIWAVAQHGHRATARYLLDHAANLATTEPRETSG